MLKVATPLSPEEEMAVSKVMDCGFAVHRHLGPGYKEKIYETAFRLELESRGIKFECEKSVEVVYRHLKIPGQRIDLIVEGLVVVEIKAVTRLKNIHRRQILSYLKTTRLRVGLLMNFNTTMLKHGIKRVVL